MAEAERAVVDFDPHDHGYRADRRAVWSDLRACPVAWSPRYGGFWVVSGYDEVARVARDEGTFSSVYRPGTPDGIEYVGVTGIPRARGIPPVGIAEAEAGLHAALRRLLNPHLLPPAVTALTPFMQDVAAWFLDRHVEDGHLDLVTDLTNPTTALTTLRIIGLPLDQWERYARVFHGTVAYAPDSPEHQRSLALIPDLVAELVGEVEDRRRSPRDDLLTELAGLRLDDGTPLDDGRIGSVLWNLVAGGLDTTSSVTALALLHLDGDHAERQRLVDDPERLTMATEEYLRSFSVNETLTRTVVADTELGGQHLRRGDHLMVSWLSANLDGRVFDRPDELVLDRSPNPHLAFGIGPHRCIGMHLARGLFRVMLRQVLDRIPDYRIDRAGTTFFERDPSLAGVVSMPATFSPAAPTGVARPF